MDKAANVQQKRKPYKKFNTEIVERLAKKYGVTHDMVRISVNGERSSDRAHDIRREYNRIIKEIQKAIEAQIKLIKE